LIVAAVFLLPGLDEKVAGVILSSVVVSAVVAAVAVARRRPGALTVAAMLSACLCLGLFAPTTFLDRDFYVWALLLFALLLAQEAHGLRSALPNDDAALTDPAPLWLGSGPTRHLVLPARSFGWLPPTITRKYLWRAAHPCFSRNRYISFSSGCPLGSFGFIVRTRSTSRMSTAFGEDPEAALRFPIDRSHP
jgi:hypothetical protein